MKASVGGSTGIDHHASATLSMVVLDQFPITLAPPIQLPEPAVAGREPAPDRRRGSPWRAFYRPLPPEFVLRELMALDLSSGPAASAEETGVFLQRWGDVPTHFGGPGANVDVGYWEGHDFPPINRLEGAGAKWAWLRTAQALVGTWTRWHLDEELSPAWTGLDWAPPSESVVEVVFAWWLTAGLAEPTRMRAVIPMKRGGPFSFQSHSVDLYEACCVQIANLIHEDLTPVACANERCNTVFVRQRGGAKHNQHRTRGVRFCTPGCQKAQSQREYRRREARKGGSSQ